MANASKDAEAASADSVRRLVHSGGAASPALVVHLVLLLLLLLLRDLKRFQVSRRGCGSAERKRRHWLRDSVLGPFAEVLGVPEAFGLIAAPAAKILKSQNPKT